MSIDFEDQLRAEMGQVQVRPRPGLAREAHRRYLKRRRRTALALTATGTAAVVAGAAAGFGLTAGTAGTGPIATTAYVVGRVSTALAATDTVGYSVSHITGHGLPAAITDPSYDWQFGDQTRDLNETPSGQPISDSSWRNGDGIDEYISVYYPSRTWFDDKTGRGRQAAPIAAADNLCLGDVLPIGGMYAKSPAEWSATIESGFKCGAFTVAGRQWIDGVDAIKLTGHKTAPEATLWVDPRSYLPVRLVRQLHYPVIGLNGITTMTLTIDFRWLPPTHANRKLLTVPIPPGFSQLSYPLGATPAKPAPKPRASVSG